MKKYGLILFFLLFTFHARAAQKVKITISNPTNRQRQEVVEIPAELLVDVQPLKVGRNQQVFVRNVLGQQVESQVTHDGKLLVYAMVRPHGKAQFTVERGTPNTYRAWTAGAQYPQRADDMAWENDKCAYRMYGPALQRSGERSFGTDVWVKNTPELVVAQRYFQHNDGWKKAQALRKQGRKAEGDSIFTSQSFHVDHGYGLDAYRVGATLGLGAPSILLGDSLVMPYCYRDYEILDEGPLRFTVHLIYNKSTIGVHKNVEEHRLVSLDRGSDFNKLTVWYEGMKGDYHLATGFPIHEEDVTSYEKGKDMLLYADPTDAMKVNNLQVYVGILFPEGVEKTQLQTFSQKHDGAIGHLIGIHHQQNNQPYTYYFGAGWSGSGIISLEDWKLHAKYAMQNIREPLAVTHAL